MNSITRKNYLIGTMSVVAMFARRMFAAAAGTVTGKRGAAISAPLFTMPQ